jgi:hypothetical protein
LRVLKATERIHPDDKAAFTQAVAKVPSLLLTESDPALYLRLEGGDESRAATRLAAYWDLRFKTFGDRAFLPMDLSGKPEKNPPGVACANHSQIPHTCPSKDQLPTQQNHDDWLSSPLEQAKTQSAIHRAQAVKTKELADNILSLLLTSTEARGQVHQAATTPSDITLALRELLPALGQQPATSTSQMNSGAPPTLAANQPPAQLQQSASSHVSMPHHTPVLSVQDLLKLLSAEQR